MDSGLLASLLRLTVKQWEIYHYRDKDQVEVDFVLEAPDRNILGIEVKASSTVFPHDFKGLRKLHALTNKKWLGGIILYDGKECLSYGNELWAIPFWMLG